MSTPASVHDLLDDALGDVVALYGDAEYSPLVEPLPGLQFTHVGEIALDCLAAGTLVSTEFGPTPIEKVTPGTRVWSRTDDGELALRSVSANLPKGTKDVLRVKTRHRALLATPNHKFLVMRPEVTRRLRGGIPDLKRSGGWWRSNSLAWSAEWIEASELEKGDFLVAGGELPSEGVDVKLIDGTPLSEEVAWFLGLMVGDGHITRQGFACCVYGELRERATEFIERTWGYEAKFNQTQGLYVYAPEMRAVFQDLGLGEKSPNRTVPSLIWKASSKVQMGFLRGYVDSDGYKRRDGYWSFAATSEQLLKECRALFMTLGFTPSNLHFQDRRGEIMINGKVIKNSLPLHRFTVYPYAQKNYEGFRGTEAAGTGFVLDRVHSVEEAGPADTYDITVEDTHNFLADGLVVHNCEMLVVTATALSPGTAFGPEVTPPGTVCLTPSTLQFAIAVVRCVPTFDDQANFPTALELSTSAATLAADGWMLSLGLHLAHAAGTFLPGCRNLVRVLTSPLGPEGGMGGWQSVWTADVT